MMKLKTVAFQVKAAGPDDGLAEGEFLGYASVFGNIDSYGDVVVKGAFTDTLSEWAVSGNALPALWGHDMEDPFANIGEVISYEEDDHGLLVKVRIDLDNPKAKQVYRLIKGRRVGQMSFAYDVEEGGWVDSKDSPTGGYYELRKLKLYEVSVVPIGANQQTEILAVKAASLIEGVKAGRVLSAKNERTLQDAHEQLTKAAERIGEVLALVASEDEEKASTGLSVKSEDPAGDNDEELRVEPVSVESSANEVDSEDEDEDLFTELGILQLDSPTERSES